MAQTRQEKNAVIEKWQRENLVRVVIKLNKNTDQDILDKLDSLDNRQGYIKALIRADISKKKKK